MATPQERLAAALETLHAVQAAEGNVIRTNRLPRRVREQLLRNGFLKPVMNGWYVAARPDERSGESTAWYASFWDFAREYLNDRFGEDWSLSPEQSLLLHAGQRAVPKQLIVRASKGAGLKTNLPHETSLYDAKLAPASGDDLTLVDGLRTYSLEAALVASGPNLFTTYPLEARTALAMQRDASGVLARLLEGGHTSVAGRLAGAFRNIGREREADDILQAMKAAGYDVREQDPFAARWDIGLAREPSPYVQRVRMMWATLRQQIPEHFPRPPAGTPDLESYLEQVEDLFTSDAYHSLSIEGYRVSPEMIDRVRSGQWNPDADRADRDQRDALAARGYWEAFQTVKASLGEVLKGQNAGEVADREHGAWHRALFAPSVQAGLIGPASLAGYRNGPVHIRGSRHAPLNPDAVRDVMPTFFELLSEEPDPSVRVVLSHFVFVYIHPYFDGNGRTARFLMNVMLAAGGYPWLVIPVQARDGYMAALESASVDGDIVPFTKFLAERVGQKTPKAAG